MSAVESQPTVSVSHVPPRRLGAAVPPLARLVPWARANWGIIAVFFAFAAAALVVPTLAPIATTDDWAYTRSAQILLDEGQLTVFPVVAATAVFPIIWGALFGLVLEPTFGVFRLSTVVITALGAGALYALCRDLGVSRGRGALGAATLLFNPLVFVLAFTFMTDAHFMALLAVATWMYARALRISGTGVGDIDGRWIVAGSVVAGLAFLARQQGALIVPAVVLFLLVTRRPRFDRSSAVLLVQLVAPMALALGGYVLWLRFGNDVPRVQSQFLREMLAEGWHGSWWLLRRLTVVELMYVGVFTLPLMAAVAPFLKRLLAGIPRRGWLLFAAWTAILLVGVAAFWVRGAYMPYIAQFFGGGGLGPPDVLGSRPILLGPDIRAVLTIVCLGASLLLALVTARATCAPSSLERSRAGLVFAIGLGQVVGVMPPSYHYIGWASGSLDRYLLPLVPLVIALALWALRDVRMALPLGWVVAAALAVFAVAGTRDYLVFMRAVWAMGEEAVAAGVPLDRLDAGSGWDGYHLYERGLQTPIRSRTPKGGPWWVYFYAPATDSSYVVSSRPLRNHLVVARRPYSSWLETKPTDLYLLRRLGASWPPTAAPRPIVTRPAPGGLETVAPAIDTPWRPGAGELPTVTPDDGLTTGSATDD